MSLIDLVARVGAICENYGRYDAERQTDADTDIVAALQRAEFASGEESLVIADSEIRRDSGDLREELFKLRILVIEKVKGLFPEDLQGGVPDGTNLE